MLRTDYKDDVFTGSRKYTMVDNQDGTVSFIDSTVYAQVGDYYGAGEINEQNELINKKGLTVSDVDIPVIDRTEGALYFFHS